MLPKPAEAPLKRAPEGKRPTPQGLLYLQRAAGNRAVSALLQRSACCSSCASGGACETEESADSEPTSGPTVQRDADDIRIKGVFPDSAEFPDHIFFDWASSKVPDTERPKLTAIAAQRPKEKLELRGFASEEGKKGSNNAIVGSRIFATSSLLGQSGHKANRKAVAKTDDSAGNIDYRRARRVEVVGENQTNVDDCSVSPVKTCGSEVATALGRASALIAGARSAMGGPPANWLPVLNRFFRSTDLGVAALVLAQMNQLDAFVTAVSAARQEPGQDPPAGSHHRCENLCKQCGSGFVATTGATPPNVLICPPFSTLKGDAGVASSQPEMQAHVILHECSHGALGTGDLAKVNERAFPFLSTSDAFRNADSLVGFIRELVTPGQTSGGPATPDTGAGATPGVAEALAFTHKWAQLSEFEANSLYNNTFKLRGDPQGWDSFGNDPAVPRFIASYNVIAAEFPPMTPPPKAPTVDDGQRLAAVKDRYDRMGTALDDALQIDQGGTEVVWSPGPGTVITVPTNFDALPLGERCRQLLRAVARVTEGISPGAVEKYVRMAPPLAQARAPGFTPL